MRTWLIISVVASILISVVIGERMYINKFTESFDAFISDELNKASDEHSVSYEEENIRILWQKHKNLIFTFTNHNLYSEIDEHLVKIKFYSDNKDYKNLFVQLSMLEKENLKLKEMILFNLANIF